MERPTLKLKKIKLYRCHFDDFHRFLFSSQKLFEMERNGGGGVGSQIRWFLFTSVHDPNCSKENYSQCNRKWWKNKKRREVEGWIQLPFKNLGRHKTLRKRIQTLQWDDRMESHASAPIQALSLCSLLLMCYLMGLCLPFETLLTELLFLVLYTY